MSVYSAEYHAMMMSPGPAGARPASLLAQSADASSPAATDSKPEQTHEGFFHHLWNVVNPLQHIPVIGTIYRAITGEHLDAVEKIAGDTLYGGLWGAVSSVADVAFEGLTGKNFEDTALALFKSDPASRVASNKVVAPTITADTSAIPNVELPALPDMTSVSTNAAGGADVVALTSAALSNSLAAKGVDSDTATRALYAYRRSMGISAAPPVLASAVGQKSL
ncbi:MAG TPA: hypothetical protein VH189_12855 [Rhizomicrobium sp.]|nr:hypothetical protein [Rhizomicrobium sp.]